MLVITLKSTNPPFEKVEPKQLFKKVVQKFGSTFSKGGKGLKNILPYPIIIFLQLYMSKIIQTHIQNQIQTNQLLRQLLKNYDKIMYLKIFITGSSNLKNMYYAAVDRHNNNLMNNKKFINPGFDLFLPENEDPNEIDKWDENIRFFGTGWNTSPVNKVDFKIKCSAQMYCDTGKIFNTGFYMYPHSSLVQTKLRLANSIGMIDVVNVDREILKQSPYQIQTPYQIKDTKDTDYDYCAKVNDSLVQICAPGLVPIYVEIVYSIEELVNETHRSSGSFVSTD